MGQLELRAHSKYELQKRGNPKAGKKLNGKQEMLLHQRRHGVPELLPWVGHVQKKYRQRDGDRDAHDAKTSETPRETNGMHCP